MALKSMVVVQHRKIIPFRRRVTVSVFFLCFLNNLSNITRIASVTCKQVVASVKLVYTCTLIDCDPYSINHKKHQGYMT